MPHENLLENEYINLSQINVTCVYEGYIFYQSERASGSVDIHLITFP